MNSSYTNFYPKNLNSFDFNEYNVNKYMSCFRSEKIKMVATYAGLSNGKYTSPPRDISSGDYNEFYNSQYKMYFSIFLNIYLKINWSYKKLYFMVRFNKKMFPAHIWII